MRAFLKIDLKNLKENYLKIKNMTNKNIIAVLKDNAYGHDLINVAKTLSSLKVNMIALATFQEALLLRKNLILTPILLFERCYNYRLLSSYNISLSVQSLSHLKELSKTNYPLSIHLEIETGFFRFGINENEIDEAIKIINNSRLKLKGVYTHIASYKTKTKQLEIFYKVIENIPNYNNLYIHSYSSSYILEKSKYENTIRIGISLYGIHDKISLKQVMSIYSPVLRCNKVKANNLVSYDNEIIKEDGYILTIGLGYGDGWHKSYNTLAFYNDTYLHQIGTTNMDYLMLFSKIEIKELSLIELLGEHLNLSYITSYYNVSPYVFLSSLSTRIKKEYNH